MILKIKVVSNSEELERARNFKFDTIPATEYIFSEVIINPNGIDTIERLPDGDMEVTLASGIVYLAEFDTEFWHSYNSFIGSLYSMGRMIEDVSEKEEGEED